MKSSIAGFASHRAASFNTKPILAEVTGLATMVAVSRTSIDLQATFNRARNAERCFEAGLHTFCMLKLHLFSMSDRDDGDRQEKHTTSDHLMNRMNVWAGFENSTASVYILVRST